MEEDQRWLQQNESKWFTNLSGSLPKTNSESTTTSIYEDANCDKNTDLIQSTNAQHLYNVPHKYRNNRSDEELNNSFKSTKSSIDHNSTPSTTSSVDSCNNENKCLSVSLKKFFKHNQLTNAKVRQEMMEKVNYSSANVDRKEDPVYWSTINVVNSVRNLLKGVQELNTNEYIDLVKVICFYQI